VTHQRGGQGVVAGREGRTVFYLESSRTDKETLARRLLAQHPIDSGLVCAFKTVEPCMSFEYHRSPDPRERGLRLRPRKCLHVYHYYVHPWLGFVDARIQTWFPFAIQVCVNGREWLAQRLMNDQLALCWKYPLDAIACQLNPLHDSIFKPWPQTYYWSAYQSEWATNLIFRDPKSLAAVYPVLVRQTTLHFHSPDVMRFLAQKAPGNFTGEIVSKVFRHRHDDPKGKLDWRPLHKGVADLHRRAQLSQAANERYLDALANVDDSTPLHELLDQVSRHTSYRGGRVWALCIGDPDDITLLQAISVSVRPSPAVGG
jgi:hypothetical protein